MKKVLLAVLCVVGVWATSDAQYYGSRQKKQKDVYTYEYNAYSQSSPFTESPSSYNYNSVYQNGYTRKDGTYVNGHYKTRSNNTNWDNYSTQGNVNPYTGEFGTRAKDYSLDAYNYGVGQTIYTGPRGGQYYINSNGNKTYVPKRW